MDTLWPPGLLRALAGSRSSIAYRSVLVDNSKSMGSRDGVRFVRDPETEEYTQVACTRWEETTTVVGAIAELSHTAETPTEIRLLNNAEPVVVGSAGDGNGSSSSSSSSGSLAAARALLHTKPNGLTPICLQLCAVAEQLRCLEPVLRANGKVALLIICSDGESTDGDIIDILKPMENMPLEVIVRVCTREHEVIDYWHTINSQLDMQIRVIQSPDVEAMQAKAENPWLAYAECLQRAREYGVDVPCIDALVDRPLTRREIWSLARLLFFDEDDVAALPDPDNDWRSFLAAVAQAQDDQPLVRPPSSIPSI